MCYYILEGLDETVTHHSLETGKQQAPDSRSEQQASSSGGKGELGERLVSPRPQRVEKIVDRQPFEDCWNCTFLEIS